MDTDKLKALFADLDNLSNAVNYEFVKKTVYDEVVAKVNVIFKRTLLHLA